VPSIKLSTLQGEDDFIYNRECRKGGGRTAHALTTITLIGAPPQTKSGTRVEHGSTSSGFGCNSATKPRYPQPA